MSVYDHIKTVPRADIGNLLSKKMCATAFYFLTVIASAVSASAQSVPNKADPTTDANSAFAPLSSVQLVATSNPDQAPSSAAETSTPPTTPTGTSGGSSSAPSANDLAREISNPVTSLWQLQFQFNNYKLESGAFLPESGKWVNNLYFQPVLPVSLTNDLNLVTRPVITLYQTVPHPTASGRSERTTAFGDMILAQVLSPAHMEPWIFGVGPTWIFPTASSDFTGQGKWQVGPAIGGGYITNNFMIAALVQQWWSFAGDMNRRRTNQMNVLPLAHVFFGEGWSVGYSGSILADWTKRGDDAWTVPIGLSVGKVVQFGPLPVQIQIAGQYFAVSPAGGPKWNIQLELTPVIPKLINETLFE